MEPAPRDLPSSSGPPPKDLPLVPPSSTASAAKRICDSLKISAHLSRSIQEEAGRVETRYDLLLVRVELESVVGRKP
ncbi:MAG: hypothetical protein EA421_17390 [Gemmatimonadales bacterium]|nr:MAG: hypothetical protein EA421_17390 [Gemmatimonadales bacterium]